MLFFPQLEVIGLFFAQGVPKPDASHGVPSQQPREVFHPPFLILLLQVFDQSQYSFIQFVIILIRYSYNPRLFYFWT